MQNVQPYESLEDALRMLDNGGRFWNFSSKAGDEVITPAELRRVAGAFGNDRTAALWFDMATADLDSEALTRLHEALDDETKTLLQAHPRVHLEPAEFLSAAQPADAVLLEGTVRAVDDETETGMILMPMMINNVTTMQMIPTAEHFTVYEIDGITNCHVLTPKQREPLQGRIRFAGLAKASPDDDKSATQPAHRLEAAFYTQL